MMFLVIFGAHRTLDKFKDLEVVGMENEPM